MIYAVRRALAFASCLVALQALPAGAQDIGETFRNLFLFGGTTVPPAAGKPDLDVFDCPPVTVSEGGAARKVGSNQVTIANVARECRGREDGATLVKVGIEGRALLGPGGASGRFDAPVTIQLKRGDTVLASRSARAAVAIPPGETSKNFIVIEDNFVVPAGTGEFDIEVSLGGPGRPAPTRSRRATR
ncbi:MAG: hypothetical protein JO048_02630 [Methylobacteriaceae bacterium]|nr:hypothetical protein [Methylobacteriaceae bacterium]